MDTGLRFGAFVVPFHSLKENVTTLLHRDLELVAFLDRLGYDEAWFGEHHSGGMEIIACPEAFAAGAAERTQRIRLGTAVMSLPYHHPLMLADRMVMIDHLTRGRVSFGFGPGALTSDAVQMGIDPLKQRTMMVEAVDAVMRLMRGETVTMETEWFTLRDARLHLPSYSRPYPEMTVAAGGSPAGPLASGRWGLGMLNISGVNDEALRLNIGHWKLYEETARQNGHVPDRRTWRITSIMHLADTREQALEDVKFGLDEWVQYFREVTSFAIVPSNITDPINYLLESRLAVIGTPDDAIRHIERIWEATGGFGVHLELEHDWAPWEQKLHHHELMMQYVVPHFRNGFASRQSNWDWCRSRIDEFVAARNVAVAAEIERHEKSKQLVAAPAKPQKVAG